MTVEPIVARERVAPPALPVPPQAVPPPAPREPLSHLPENTPAVSPAIRLDPPTGVVVTRWYQGEEVANQIPTPRQLDAYRFGQEANGLLRGTGETEPAVAG